MNSICSKFDFEYFMKAKTAQTDRALRSVGNRDISLTREVKAPIPLRGFWSSYGDDGMVVVRKIRKLFNVLIKSIDHLNISENGKNILRNFEIFQFSQKGPVAPVPPNSGTDKVVASFTEKRQNPLVVERSKELMQEFLELYEHVRLYSVRADAHEINFQEYWKKLPSSTMRGFPFNSKGKDVDDIIMDEAGSTFDSALEYFYRAPQNICFTGVRLQGSPGLQDAKIRLVSIPIIYYQYINLGLVHPLMFYLKQFPSFCAWLDPDSRDQVIMNALKKAKELDCVLLAMDYSKFDRCCNYLLREYAYEAIRIYFSNTPDIDKGFSHQNYLAKNQFIIFKQGRRIFPVCADVLLSGVVDTQLVGSLINLALQGVLRKRLGSPALIDLGFALGDDTLLLVKKDYIKQGGLKGVNMKISEIVSEYGFEINVDKAYPTDDSVFLQRVYDVDDNLVGIGSYIRTINSGAFKERFSNLPEGIESIEALDAFSQIAMISDVERKNPIYTEFRAKFADFWLDHDDGLKAIIAETYDSTLDVISNAHRMVSLLIDLTTKDVSALHAYFNTHGYDRYNLVVSLSQPNYGMAFNFAGELVSAGERGNYRAPSIKEIFGVERKLVLPSNTESDDFVED